MRGVVRRIVGVVALGMVFPLAAAGCGGGQPVAQLTVSSLPTVSAPASSSVSGPAWQLVWQEEFDAPLSTQRWQVEPNPTFGDGNNEAACLTSRSENLQVAGGTLRITARREAKPYRCRVNDTRYPKGRPFTTSMITTEAKLSWTYGRFEVRAKLPLTAGSSQGLWPAVWMRPNDRGIGEMDILEAVGTGQADQPVEFVHTLTYDYKKTHSRIAGRTELPPGVPSVAEDFHLYAMEWEQGVVRWFTDGRLVFQATQAEVPWLTKAFSRPFFLRVNLAVGGDFAGKPTASTTFPATFEVDWIKVYQRAG